MAEQTGALYSSYKDFEVGGQSGADAARDLVNVDRAVKAAYCCLRETARRGRH